MGKGARAITSLSRVVVALLLLVAGVQKVTVPESFARDISHYHLLPKALVPLSALAVPWLEVLVGALLLLGWLARPAALLASGLSLGFAVFVGSAVARGLDVDCGCFTGHSKVSWMHVGLDLAMLAMSVVVLKRGAGPWSLDEYMGTEEEEPALKWPALAGCLLLLCNLGYLGLQGLPRLALPKPALDFQGKASLVFDPPSIDLGTVKQEEHRPVQAVFKNEGTRAAHIVNVRSSCGCTSAKPRKDVLLPGESSVVDITYSPGPNRGEFTQFVELTLDDGSKPVRVYINGVIAPWLKADPELLILKPREPKVVTFKARDGNQTLNLLEISSPLKDLQYREIVGTKKTPGTLTVEFVTPVKVPVPEGDGVVWPVQVRAAPDKPPGTIFVKGAENS